MNINSGGYSLKQLKANQQYDIEVIFTSNFYNKTKKATVNVTDHITNYINFLGKNDFSQDNFKYAFGDESNEFFIEAPKLKLNIEIDNNKVKATYEYGNYVVNVGDLDPGTHIITVSYGGDEKYAKKAFNKSFEVVAKANGPSEVEQDSSNYFTLALPDDAIGNLTVEFENLDNNDFKSYKTIEVENSNAEIELETDHVGHYQFKAYFNGNYELNEIIGQYLVKDTAIWILNNDYGNIPLNENYFLTLKMPKDGFGNLTINVKKDGNQYENYTLDVIDGTCKILLPTNHIGEYSIETAFKGNYELLPYKQTYEVDSDYYINLVDDYELKFNSKQYISIELPEDGTGTLTLEIKYNDDDNYTFYKSIELNKGKASIKFPTNKVGHLYYNALYSGNYELYNSTNQQTNIIPLYTFKNNIFTLISDDELNGIFSIFDWSTDKTFTKKVINGTASIDLRNYLKQINKKSEFSISFISNDGEEVYMDYKEVYPNVKIVAKDITMYYGDNKIFKAKVYRNDKVVGKGEKITIIIGSTKYQVKTDKNGIIKLKITQIPKKYTIKSVYKGKTFKNKLTVKQILTLKTVKVKKSAKKTCFNSNTEKQKSN